MSTLVPVHDSSDSVTTHPHSADSALLPTPSADPVVAVCATHADADVTVRALGRADFDMKKLSVIGKGYHTTDHAVGFYTTGDRVKAWGASVVSGARSGVCCLGQLFSISHPSD